MNPIEDYHTIDVEARLCDALSVLKQNHENIKACGTGVFHKTLFVVDADKKIVGKLSMYDLIRGLVPDPAKRPNASRAYYTMLSSRAQQVSDDVSRFQEHFQWLHHSFFDLVKQEAQKGVKDIMSPVDPILKEDDTINHAIYLMFKENIRLPLVVRGKEIVGVLDLMRVFTELLEIAGPECYVTWET
jgi:CBS domain-containing protein